MNLIDACRDALRTIGVETDVADSSAAALSFSADAGWSGNAATSARADLHEQRQVETFARSLNVRMRKVQLPASGWTPIHGALVAFRVIDGYRTPIVLPPGQMVDEQLGSSLDPNAYFFYRPLPTRPLRLREFFRAILAEAKNDGRRLILAGIATSVLGLGIPLLTAAIFDELVPTKKMSAVIVAIVGLLIVTASIHIADFMAALFRAQLQARISHASKASIMDRILLLPTVFFRNYPVGGLLTRSGIADSEQERRMISAFGGFFAGVFSLSNLFVLFWFNTQLGMMSIGAAFLVLVCAFAVSSKKTRLERSIIECTVRVRSLLFQIFSGISKVRTAGAESRMLDRWEIVFQERQRLGFASSRINSFVSVFHSVLPLACMAAFFYILGKEGHSGNQLSPGEYLAVFAAFSAFMAGMARVSGAVSDVAVARPRLERAQPILLAPLERSRRGRSPGTLSGQIELNKVSFRYSAESQLVLSEIQLRIEPGEFVAIVGPSGSGKSTLVRLLLGFEQPETGEVLYDGRALSELDVFEVRRQIGTVLQHDNLIAGNIFENIAAVRSISIEQAWEAARIAGLDQDLARMPMGLHSFVNPGARAFSGGERQRMMIARAVAGQPRILLFDEATSALDNRVQAEVMHNLRDLRLTRIVVAHRLSTIQQADRILVLDRGRLVECGDFHSLLAQDGLFAKLARRQSV